MPPCRFQPGTFAGVLSQKQLGRILYKECAVCFTEGKTRRYLHQTYTKFTMNKPQEISPAEWKEIIQVPAVRESWGLEDETPEEFADMVYGVKFDFVSGGPGYCGDLYVLHGGALGEPMSLIRKDGRLEVV